MENPIKIDDLGVPPIFGNTSLEVPLGFKNSEKETNENI